MKKTYYFSHDYDARADEKIQNLIYKMVYEGYGLFWAITEMLYQNDGYMRLEYERIAFALHTDEDKVQKLINDFGLFKVNTKKFHSESVLNRLIERDEKSRKATNSALTRWNKDNKKDANAMRTQCDSNAIKESKVKERKLKDKKVKYGEFVCLLSDEYDKLINEYGERFTQDCIKTLDNYKGAKGKTYKSDYRAILSWVVDKVREKQPTNKTTTEAIKIDNSPEAVADRQRLKQYYDRQRKATEHR